MHPDVDHETDIRIPVGDETVAATWFLPQSVDDPAPAVLWATPYPKERERFGRYGPILEYLAGHGYHVVLANLVGTGASTGRFRGLASPDTGRQCSALVEWIADQSWATDQVGVIGKSAGGYTSLVTAAANPEPLAVAIPIMAPTDTRRTLYDPGGNFRLSSVLGWAGLFATLVTEPPSRRDEIEEWRRNWEERLDLIRQNGPELFGFPGLFTDETANAYWSYEIPIEEIDVPTFIVGGVRDTFAYETIEFFERICAPKRLLLGPWRHVIPHRGRESAIDFRPRVIKWLDQFLRDEALGVLEGPQVTYWTERDGGRQINQGIWRGGERWPSVDNHQNQVSFVATDDGLVLGDEADNYQIERTYDFNQTVGVDSVDYGSDWHDTTPDDLRSLVFESDPLDRALEWTGTGKAKIQLASTTPEASVSVRAMDVDPNGRSHLVARGARRLGNGREMVRIEPGEISAVPIKFGPTSHLFEAGHRLRLAIAAADFPRHLPVDSDGQFTINSAPSASTTIAVPGQYRRSAEFDNTVEMGTPDDSLGVVPPTIVDQQADGQTCRRHSDESATISREVRTELQFPHVNRIEAMDYEMSVHADEPSSARGQLTYESHLQHDTDPIHVRAEPRITHDKRSLELKVTVADEEKLNLGWSTQGTPIQ